MYEDLYDYYCIGSMWTYDHSPSSCGLIVNLKTTQHSVQPIRLINQIALLKPQNKGLNS